MHFVMPIKHERIWYLFYYWSSTINIGFPQLLRILNETQVAKKFDIWGIKGRI